MSNDSDEEEHKVGYKRPPKKSQFKPGQSGNPLGRGAQRDEHSLRLPISQIVRNVLHTQVTIKSKDGKKRQVSAAEAIFTDIVVRSTQGDAAARRALLKLIDMYGAILNAPPSLAELRPFSWSREIKESVSELFAYAGKHKTTALHASNGDSDKSGREGDAPLQRSSRSVVDEGRIREGLDPDAIFKAHSPFEDEENTSNTSDVPNRDHRPRDEPD